MLAGFLDEDFVKLLRTLPCFLLVKLLLKLYRELVIAFFGYQALDFIKLIGINLDEFIRVDVIQEFVVF